MGATLFRLMDQLPNFSDTCVKIIHSKTLKCTKALYDCECEQLCSQKIQIKQMIHH